MIKTPLDELDDSGYQDLPIGYVLLDSAGRLLWGNQAFFNLLKLKSAAWQQMALSQWIIKEDQLLFEQSLQALTQNHLPAVTCEVRLLDVHDCVLTVRFSMKIHAELNGCETLSAHARQVQVIIENIGTERLLQQQLALAQQQIVLANQAKSHFLGVMNHEIRTPLNVILGYSELLLEQVESLPLLPNFIRDLVAIRSAGRHLAELLNNILDLSKIEANKLNIYLEPVELSALIQTVYHLNREQAEIKNLVFSVVYEDGLPQQIISDRIRLMQVLTNLVNNAVKFTPPHKAVQLAVGLVADTLQFRVIDQGIGLSKERQVSIFEMFRPVDMSATPYFGGTGLGLNLVRALVELLGGTLTVASEPGQGSVFTVTLPLVVAEVADSQTIES